MTDAIKKITFWILSAAFFATFLYFTLSSITYGLLLVMPTIAALSSVATYFATVGVMGLSCALLILPISLLFTPFCIDNQKRLLFLFFTLFIIPISISLVLAVPFFISILAGAPAFITSSFLSLSAANISYLTAGTLIVSGVASKIITYEISNSHESNDEKSCCSRGGCDRYSLLPSDNYVPSNNLKLGAHASSLLRCDHDYRDDNHRMTISDLTSGKNL